jgi:FkbM family methyltransferase
MASEPADAPAPVAPWKIKVAATAARLSPLRFRPVRRRFLTLRRERDRRRRRALEARGDFSRSRPALFAMDVKVDRHLDRDGGFFVEAGANDGYLQSNTYWLARARGWRGLLVEPVPELHAEAVVERPESRVVNAALVPEGEDGGTVTMHYGGLMSIVKGSRGGGESDAEYVAPAFVLGLEEPYEVTVPGRTLSALLDEAGAPEVDLLSLDVEGFEPQVLRGIDWERHAPRYLLVEHQAEPERRAAIEAVLGDRYAVAEELSPYDTLYVRRRPPA